MALESRIQIIYKEIQRQLFYMIPEKWNKLYLYSSIISRSSNLETDELYFYYIPKGVLKKNPINVYEIPARFLIDESQYLKLVDNLYSEIKRLQKVSQDLGEEKWNSIIISIADFKFEVEYRYEDMINYNFSSYEKHVIFRYKYLQYPFNSFNKNEKEVISRYIYQRENNRVKVKEYSEVMYEMPFETIEAGSKNSNIKYIKEEDIKLLEEKKDFKSQILKSGF